jgi:hypothetical protein
MLQKGLVSQFLPRTFQMFQMWWDKHQLMFGKRSHDINHQTQKKHIPALVRNPGKLGIVGIAFSNPE